MRRCAKCGADLTCEGSIEVVGTFVGKAHIVPMDFVPMDAWDFSPEEFGPNPDVTAVTTARCAMCGHEASSVQGLAAEWNTAREGLRTWKDLR